MAMGIGEGGHGPSEVTCRIGGDRPGCDFMITTLGERWAGTSTERFDVGGSRRPGGRERDLIRTRTAEGRNRAKAQEKPMGRPPSLTPAQQKEATRPRAGCYVAGIGGKL
jgi:hypothetical protein